LSDAYTEGEDFDNYLAGNPTHGDFFTNASWLSDSGVTSGSITFDFGSTTTIESIALWNFSILML
jgi:hypothetical protein